jgi:hypothetical protein
MSQYIIYGLLIFIFVSYYIYYNNKNNNNEEYDDILEKKIDNILAKKKKKNIHTTMEACKNGLIQSCLATMVTTGGNIPVALTAGIAGGLVGGIVHHIKKE